MEKLLKSRLKFVAFSQLSFRILLIYFQCSVKVNYNLTDDYLQTNWIRYYAELPVFIYNMYQGKQINCLNNILQCNMFSWLLYLLTFFVTVDRKCFHGTDVLLINIIISVYCCIELSIITNILQHILCIYQ